jgi:hypothetical protein
LDEGEEIEEDEAESDSDSEEDGLREI